MPSVATDTYFLGFLSVELLGKSVHVERGAHGCAYRATLWRMISKNGEATPSQFKKGQQSSNKTF